MYPITDPSVMMSLYHQRAEELYREADERRMVREARQSPRHRVGRRHRASARPRPVLP